VFWTWEDKLPWIAEELRAGRLRQGWGAEGTALTDDFGRLLSVEDWLVATHDYFAGWPEPVDEVTRRTRYSILKTMLEMDPGDLVVVPRVPTGETFTIAVVAEGYHFDGRHFGTDQSFVPRNDCAHVVGVERESQGVFSVKDPDAGLVARQFRHYRRAVNAVRSTAYANQVRALFGLPVRSGQQQTVAESAPRPYRAYRDFFVSNPQVLGGQTVFAGTRVPLRTVLASLAEGDSVEDILRAFPTLTREHVAAAVAFAASSALEDQPIQGVPKFP
jgi:uncharacterized protein (DUF433 family)